MAAQRRDRSANENGRRRLPDTARNSLRLYRSLLGRGQVHRSMLAATIDFEFELEPVAFVQRRHAGALDRTDVHERIRLAIVALNEAEALHGVEELDRPRSLFTRQLTLRATGTGAARRTWACVAIPRRAAILDRHRLAVDLEVGRRDAAATIDESEAERLTLGQAGQARLLDCGDVYEHILTAVVADDKAEALLPVEKLNDARGFADDLRGHAATATAAAAEAAATATAAAEATTAAATAEAIATAAKAAAATAEAIAAAAKAAALTAAAVAAVTLVAETVALVPAAPAAFATAPSIKTHDPVRLPASPDLRSKTIASDEGRRSSGVTIHATESLIP
jgi:hypothetical protein